MDHSLSPTTLGGGTTQIFHGSKTSPWAREEPLIMPKANTPSRFHGRSAQIALVHQALT